MKPDFYIVYDSSTFKVIKTFRWFGKCTDFIGDGKKGLIWLNRTHPKHKDTLKKLIWT